MYVLGTRPFEAEALPGNNTELEATVYMGQIKRNCTVPDYVTLQVEQTGVGEPYQVCAYSDHVHKDELNSWVQDFRMTGQMSWDVISKSHLGYVLNWRTLSSIISGLEGKIIDPVIIDFKGTLHVAKSMYCDQSGVWKLVVE